MADVRIRIRGWLLGLVISRIVDTEDDDEDTYVGSSTAAVIGEAPRPDLWREGAPGDFGFRR